MQFHVWEDAWLDDDRWHEKMEELKRQRLIRAIGHQHQPLGAREWHQALRTGLVDAVQVIYNIFDQNPEDELFPAVRRIEYRRDRARAV